MTANEEGPRRCLGVDPRLEGKLSISSFFKYLNATSKTDRTGETARRRRDARPWPRPRRHAQSAA